MIRSCHLSFLTLLAIAFSTGANAQESRSPSAAEIAQCDQIVHRYHEQKYPEMLAYSDRIMAEGERSVTRHYHIANGRRDSYLAARTDMTAFLSDGHMLPTDRKELLKFTAMRINDYSEDTSDIKFALYAAVLGCTGTARLAAMDGRPFVLPKALASLQPSAALNNQSSTEGETSTTNTNGSLNQAQIDACSNDIKTMQVQSQSWPGDVNDTAARLGQYQKDMFESRCAAHPQAQAYIASANRMLGNGGGAGTTKNGKRSNVSDANATHCLAPQKEGGVINSCDYAVEYNYCVVQPTPGSWAASFDCNQGKSGSWQVGPNSRAIMQTSGSQVAFFGCKYGPTLSNPDGISPADFRYNANGMPTGRCREWGAP